MSSQGRGELRRSDALWWLRACWLAGLLAAPFLLSGCAVSKFSNPFGAGSPDTSASAVTEDRLLETAKADSGNDLPGGLSAHCPQVVAWPRDRLLTIYQPGHVGDNLAVVHRGEITKMARECQIYSDRVVVRYGFAGRVLLGPKGIPGTVNLPVSIRVAGTEQKTLATDKMTSPRPCRKATRSAISRWCGRSPSPSSSARGPRTTRSSSPSSAPSPAPGSRSANRPAPRRSCRGSRLAVFTLTPKNCSPRC